MFAVTTATSTERFLCGGAVRGDLSLHLCEDWAFLLFVTDTECENSEDLSQVSQPGSGVTGIQTLVCVTQTPLRHDAFSKSLETCILVSHQLALCSECVSFFFLDPNFNRIRRLTRCL